MKVRLAAIAKDEGAYLPEWIYWHLTQGFDDIYICINNSSDNSDVIAKKIAEKNPVTVQLIDNESQYGFNNSLINADFLKKNPLQSKLYADIYAKSSLEGFTHVMFLDIDEFLVSQETSIQNVVASSSQDDVILFNWFNISGDKTPFSCVGSNLKGEKSSFTKYLIKTGLSDIQFISTHNIQTTNSSKVLFGRSETNDNSNYIKDSGWSDKAFILHRHLRSQPEYLSLLSRGDTWDNSLIGLKNNRHGWSDIGIHSVPIEQLNLENYKPNFEKFLRDCDIQEQVINARQYVLKRAESTKEVVSRVQNLNRDLDRVLAGTNLQHVDRGLKYTLKRWFYQFMLKRNINNY